MRKSLATLTWRDDSYDLAFLKEGERMGEDYPDHVIMAFIGS